MGLSAALGPFCAFMSSVTWAVGSATYSRLSGRNNPFAINASRALVALPIFVLAEFLLAGWSGGLRSFGGLGVSHLGWFSLSMFASYGVGDVLFFWSTQRIGVPSALAIASAYPLWMAGAGVIFKGESLVAAQILGLFAVVAGVIVVILSGRRARTLAAKGETRLGYLLAMATSFFWALNAFAVSQGGQDISPFTGNALRMVIAIVFATGLGRVMAGGQPRTLSWSELKPVFWIFVFEAFGGSAFYMYGLSHSPLAIGSALTSLAPVLAVPVSLALRLEKFSVIKTLGIVSVVAGVVLLLR